jgi:hypothetical protein
MKTTRVSVALTILRLIRSEKNPPIARYETLLILAASMDANGNLIPLTTSQITEASGDSTFSHGNIQNAVSRGFAKTIPNTHPVTYTLTNQGMQEVQRVLLGQKAPKVPAADLEKIKAAAQALSNK